MSHGTGPSVRSPMCKTGAREIGGKFEIIETGGNRRKKKGGGIGNSSAWCQGMTIPPPVKPRQRQNHQDDEEGNRVGADDWRKMTA